MPAQTGSIGEVNAASSDVTANCPRCGYDQRGPVSTWKESCPLQGTCSECGLVFNWPEVLMPEKFEPRWCVEFVPRKRSIPIAAAKTFVRSFNPWKFWSRIRMSQPIRTRRLVVYCLMLLLPFLLLYVGAQTWLAIVVRSNVQLQYSTWNQQIATQLNWAQSSLKYWQTAQQYRQLDQGQREVFINAQFPEQVNNEARAQYKTNIEESLRFEPQFINSQIQLLQSQVTLFQGQSAGVPVIAHSYAAAILEAVFLPFSRVSFGSIQLPDGTSQPYPAPINLLAAHLNMLPGLAGFAGVQRQSWRWMAGVASAILLTFLFPVTFILLPVSRRRAKVRWAHVNRIVVYSLFALTTLLLVMIALGILQVFVDSDFASWVVNQSSLVFWIALPVWWAVAIKRYLKMQHSAAIAGIMTFMLALLLSPLLLHVFPQWMMRMILD